MKSRRTYATLCILTAATFSACGGRLQVGDKHAQDRAGSGNSQSDSGGADGDDTDLGGRSARGGSGAHAGSVSLAGRPNSTAGAGGSAVGGTNGTAASGGTNGMPPAAGTSGSSGVEPMAPIDGSSKGCPDGPLTSAAACDTPGITCAYRFPSGNGNQYQECACAPSQDGNGTVWNCYTQVNTNSECPTTTPENHDDCFGYYGSRCQFPPRKFCQCSESDGWTCDEPEPPPSYLDPPTSPPADRAVADLSESERTDWCTWYAVALAGGPGYPLPKDLPVDASGNVQPNGCSATGFPCDAILPELSIAQCAATLAVSSCQAPISSLTQCIAGGLGGCDPAGSGCIDYFTTPDCNGTLATEPGSNASVTKCPTVRVQ